MKSNYQSYTNLLLLSLGLLAAHNVNALDLDDTVLKTITVEQRSLAEVAPNSDSQPTLLPHEKRLKVTAWVDHPDAIYQRGDTVTFSVRSNKDAYITLIDIGTTGEAHVIFPNNFQRNNSIKAGTTLSIPEVVDGFQFKVHGKKGRELVKVIATTHPKVIIDPKNLVPSGDFQVITKNISAVAVDINQLLNDPSNPIEWD